MVQNNKQVAGFLELQIAPFLQSIEDYLMKSGISSGSFSSYTEARKWVTSAARTIGSGGPLWVSTADAAFVKLMELQKALPVLLEKMPPAFAQRWALLAEEVAKMTSDPANN